MIWPTSKTIFKIQPKSYSAFEIAKAKTMISFSVPMQITWKERVMGSLDTKRGRYRIGTRKVVML